MSTYKLNEALSRGNYKAAEELLRGGTKLDGNSLFFAVRGDNVDLVDWVLDSRKESPFDAWDYAGMYGSVKVLEYLHDMYPFVCTERLHMYENHQRTIDWLLENCEHHPKDKIRQMSTD